MRELYPLFFVLGFIALLLGALIYAVSVLQPRECANKWSDVSEEPPRWGFNQGCMIKVDGKWIPSTAYWVNK